MRKILILITLLGFNSCKNIDQHGSEPDLFFTKKNAPIVREICETLDFKQAKDGVYKSSDGECVVTGDYPVVREGERCQSKMHCEIEELRAARLQSAKEWQENIIKTAKEREDDRLAFEIADRCREKFSEQTYRKCAYKILEEKGRIPKSTPIEKAIYAKCGNGENKSYEKCVKEFFENDTKKSSRKLGR